MGARLVFGVGINDVNSKTQEVIKHADGTRKVVWVCPYYTKWYSMLRRCYSITHHRKFPHYQDCEVFDDWKFFSNFKEWMNNHDWEGKDLDKDLIKEGNRNYHPDLCCFLPPIVNTFMTDSKAKRGKYPLGVYFRKDTRKFKAQCGNPFTTKQVSLGSYDCPYKAHEVYKKKKFEFAIKLSQMLEDPLRTIFINKYRV